MAQFPVMFLYPAVGLICFYAVFRSADVLVRSSSAIASHFGIPPFFIGVVLVGIGTSSPEIFVTAIASFARHPDIVIGNAAGSIAANTGIAMAAIFWLFEKGSLKASAEDIGILGSFRFFITNFVFLSVGAAVMMFAFNDGLIGRPAALLLLLALAVYFFLSSRISKKYLLPPVQDKKLLDRFLQFAAALVILLVSSRAIVWAAASFAAAIGISEFIIALTIIAVGTSLPEIATSISATRHGELGIAVGELVGSQALNLYFLLGISALLRPIVVARPAFVFGWLSLLTGEICVLIWLRNIPGKVKALILFATYCLYIFFNFRLMA